MRGYPDRGPHGRAVQDLGQRIMGGQLAPGETLNVDDLCTEYDVSRSVMREAIKVLSAKGLLDARPRRGTFVRDRQDWNLLDPDVMRWRFEHSDQALFDKLAEVRDIVEPAGAALAAQRRTEKVLERLGAAMASLDVASGRAQVAAADIEFHRSLFACTQNELLEQMQMMIDVGLQARDLLVHGSEGAPLDESRAMHRAVYEAVVRGDAEAARAAMELLLTLAAADVHDVVARATPAGARTRRP